MPPVKRMIKSVMELFVKMKKGRKPVAVFGRK